MVSNKLTYSLLIFSVILNVILLIFLFLPQKIETVYFNETFFDVNNATLQNISSNIECNSDSYCKNKYNKYWKCYYNKCVCPITTQLNPVCGSDGKTYENPSEAKCKGVSIVYTGRCNNAEIRCFRCGDECMLTEGKVAVICPEETKTLKFSCRLINGRCEKVGNVDKNSVCGNGICEKGEVSKAPECPDEYPVCDWVESFIICPQDCEKI